MKQLWLCVVLLTASCHSMGASHREPAKLSETYQVVSLKNAEAYKVAGILADLTRAPDVGPDEKRRSLSMSPITCSSDDRTNSVIVGASKEDMPRILELITKLDVAVQ